MASLDPVIDPVLDKDGVRLTVDDAIATVTLTNPAKRNAQSPALWRALAEAGRLLPGTVRVVVLRAEGKSFSAGLDRQAFTPEGFDGEPSFIDLARGGDAELDATIAEYQEAFTWWRRSPGACHRRRIPAGPRLRPARRRRRRAVRHA
jgi:enoyl-CoA hydratase/carnithine racemase